MRFKLSVAREWKESTFVGLGMVGSSCWELAVVNVCVTRDCIHCACVYTRWLLYVGNIDSLNMAPTTTAWLNCVIDCTGNTTKVVVCMLDLKKYLDIILRCL